MISYECPPQQLDPPSNEDNSGNRISPVSETGSDRFDGSQLKEPQTIGFATVFYDFNGRYDDELSVQAGYSVRVIQICNEEWTMCWNPVNGRSGIIPSSYLQIFLDEDDVDDATVNAVNGIGYDDETSTKPLEYSWYDQKTTQALYSEVPNGSMLYSEVPVESSHPPLPKVLSHSELPKEWTTFSSPSSHPPLPSQYSWPSDTQEKLPQNYDQSVRDSGNNSLSPSNVLAEEDGSKVQKQVESNLDDFFELFGLKNQPDQKKTESSTPPPRPPLPASRPVIQPMRVAPSRPTSRTSASSTSSPDWQAKFAKIVEELLSSEIQYSTELHVWEKCINQSIQLGEQQKVILTNGYPMLRDLSHYLIRSIAAEQIDRPAEYQCYGQMFLDMMRDRISKTYAYYFRCVEEISEIIDNKKDQATQDALHQCLQRMRDEGVFVFDVTTTIVRPIQRCLKYPLFIAELLKLLPITHIDHPKLLEAKKQMDGLVKKMNESKRRKELMKKYRDDPNQDSLVDKLSKFNLHSIQKKSNRLKYRLVASIGFANKPDPEFTSMLSELNSAERRLCKFMYNVQIYKMRVTFMTNKFMKICSVSTKKMCAQESEVLGWEINAYLKMIGVFLQTFQKEIMNEIEIPSQQLRKSQHSKMIEKRCDKLADYETARAQKSSPDEVERFRCEFEALNMYVKGVLPKVWTTINEGVSTLAEKMIDMDGSFFHKVQTYVAGKPEKLNVFNLPKFDKFVDPNNQRLSSFRKHLQAIIIIQKQQAKLAASLNAH